MTINEYQTEALRTAAGMNHPNNDEILLNGVMGLCGESGECVDMVRSTASKVTSWTKLTSQKSWAMWRGISQLPPTLSATTSRRCCR